nr:transcription termination/antitermination protein NusA [Anaerolineae bacterium]
MAKSELLLAFNEIAELRKLPRDTIIEALKAALVTAYRRYAGVSQAQLVEARVDERTGKPSVWVEKEVVETVQSELTEVLLSVAREYDPDVQLGDIILVEDTPDDFGRIAAQTAKQVILQRMREAEREAQYLEYQDRVGDLVTGTVQSESGERVTIGLGRTEAILPRSQQMPGERYRMHDKVRAYVMEVNKASRGPQIIVSRTHRNMLRRLLELEVPEIYNGTVEIKSIAREPGARSKVAVTALQPGADPVGACVGMRGMRIQSIVKELNGEKIDVIEWSPEPSVFISKALSPARVTYVFLDDDPIGGRTATVVVSDDQLSLAIGREGQNARLAAKLTGWRIDIKSVSEASSDAYIKLTDDPQHAEFVAEYSEMFEDVVNILQKKADSRPIMPEEYLLLADFVKKGEGYLHDLLEADRVDLRARMKEVREQVPAQAYEHPLDDTDLPLRVYNLLVEGGYTTVGRLMEQYYVDPDRLLEISGFGPAALDHVRELVESVDYQEPTVEEIELETALEELQTEDDRGPEITLTAEEMAAIDEDWDDDSDEARARRAQLVAQMMAEKEVVSPPSEVIEAEEGVEAAAPSPDGAETPHTSHPEMVDIDEDDLIEYEDMTDEEREEVQRKRAKQRRRQLVYDEEVGRVVSKRRRKSSRRRQEWLEEDENTWE